MILNEIHVEGMSLSELFTWLLFLRSCSLDEKTLRTTLSISEKRWMWKIWLLDFALRKIVEDLTSKGYANMRPRPTFWRTIKVQKRKSQITKGTSWDQKGKSRRRKNSEESTSIVTRWVTSQMTVACLRKIKNNKANMVNDIDHDASY